jgi:hypothetical protein
VVTVSTSCVAIFSNILSSWTPCRKAVMIEASETQGMVLRTLVKRAMKAQRVSPGFLPYGMEMSLHAMLLINAGKVRYDPCIELLLGINRSRGQIHEPGPGWPGQGYMEITHHHSGVSTSCRNGGDVNLQKFRRV